MDSLLADFFAAEPHSRAIVFVSRRAPNYYYSLLRVFVSRCATYYAANTPPIMPLLRHLLCYHDYLLLATMSTFYCSSS